MTDTVEQKTLAQFIAEHHITMTATRIPARTDSAYRDKDWDATAYHYCCVLRRNVPAYRDRTEMTVYYSMGSGHVQKIPFTQVNWTARSELRVVGFSRKDWDELPLPGGRLKYHWQADAQKIYFRPVPPTAEDVLGSLAMDAGSIENSRHFEEWANESGYDTDSRKAEASYNECKRLTRELEIFLGRKGMQTLINDVERL